jgi:hypothetical protein
MAVDLAVAPPPVEPRSRLARVGLHRPELSAWALMIATTGSGRAREAEAALAAAR